ncbi:MAG: glycosyl transferase family protein [Paracoccaceae bacterium]|nr:glycosyl transferase family protein [Paracoccaceae bacterium]
MNLAPYIQAMGRGPARARHLTREEAREAMRLILCGAAAPEAVGAFLMLMRYRGETAEEVAGMVEALRDGLPAWEGPRPVLDWPSYAAGRSRGLPWFLLSARLVAGAGVPVLLHGWNAFQSPVASVRAALPALGIGEARDLAEAGQIIARDGIAYLPLEAIAPEALRILRLREVLGLRSPVNTALRLLNPGGAPASVQGVFHPPYRELQADAAALLAQPSLTVLKGGGGEFERHPAKSVALFGLRNGAPWEETASALIEETRRLADAEADPADLAALWQGETEHPFARAIVLGTAMLALDAAGVPDAAELAVSLWARRHGLQSA